MYPTSIELRYFLEVYHVRQMTRAALRLGLTQPTLTQAIRSLEQKMGTSLFHRSKQGVVPTKAAVHFYALALKLNSCWSDIQTEMQKSTSEIEGVFTVGCHQSVAAYVIPPLLKRIDQDCPKVSIRLVHEASRRITEKVVAFEVDFGYVVNPFKHPDLVFRKVGDDRVTFWSARRFQGQLPKRIFADGHRDQVEILLGKTFKRYFKNWKIVDSTSLEVIRTLTALGLGVGVLPERVALAEKSGLEVFDSSLPIRPDEIYLVYRKEVMASSVAKDLLKIAALPLL